MRKAVRLGVATICGLLVLGYGSYRLSKSRSFQILGDVVTSVDTQERAVALTFDDGPTRGYTEEILEILDREDVKATFFLVGADIEKNPAEAEKIVLAGHEVGNHTYSHHRMVFKSLPFIREEIERTDTLIRRAGYADRIHFRAPFGKRLFLLPYYLWKTGRKNIYYDVEPESFGEVATDTGRIVDHVLTRSRPGSIILLHVMFSGRTASMSAVPAIISGLKEKGYTFKTLSELLKLGS